MLGYGFIDQGSWRGLFYLSFGIECLSGVLIFIFYHPDDTNSRSEETKLDQLKSLDYIGAILGISGLVLFLLGVSFGGVTAPWYCAEIPAYEKNSD